MTMNYLFVKSIKRLIGEKCWAFTAGKGTGSILSLDFGNKVRREKPLRNKKLDEEKRNFIGEYSFLIYCSWRINSEKSVISSSKSLNDDNGQMLSGLNHILNSKVKDVNCFKPSYDLKIVFENNYCLTIFCDEINNIEKYDNYSFYDSRNIFTIENGSNLKTSTRTII